MSNPVWDRKRTRDAHLAHVPYGLRQKMMREAAENEKQQDEGKVPPQFLKHQKKPGEQPGKSSKKKDDKQKNEATTTGMFIAMPKPMLAGTAPGHEMVDPAYQDNPQGVKTSPGERDGHTHDAYIDGNGNGETSMDAGHKHSVVAGMVAPSQDSSGEHSHYHDGALDRSGSPTYEPTPPYYGNPNESMFVPGADLTISGITEARVNITDRDGDSWVGDVRKGSGGWEVQLASGAWYSVNGYYKGSTFFVADYRYPVD